MGFPRANSTNPPPQAGAFGGPPPPPPGNTPPPPPAPTAPARMVYVGINGQSVLKTEAEARMLPPATPALFQGEEAGGWKTVGQILPAGVQQQPAYQQQVVQQQRPAFGAPGQPSAPAQSGVPAGVFAGVENAQVSRRGAYLSEGNYVAKLLSAEYKTGRHGNMVLLEMLTMVSSYDPQDPTKHKCNQEGTTFTVFIKQNDSFLGNIKEVILALSGFDANGKPRDETDTVTTQECNELVGAGQPYANAVVYLEARDVTTRNNQPFTRINWWPCPLLPDGSPDLQRLQNSR